jgi:hypothetical protein
VIFFCCISVNPYFRIGFFYHFLLCQNLNYQNLLNIYISSKKTTFLKFLVRLKLGRPNFFCHIFKKSLSKLSYNKLKYSKKNQNQISLQPDTKNLKPQSPKPLQVYFWKSPKHLSEFSNIICVNCHTEIQTVYTKCNSSGHA